MASFVSQSSLNKARDIKKKLQEDALSSAKKEFVKKQDFAQQREENRKDNWVTSSLESRLKADEEVQLSHKKHKKSHKKHKKKTKTRKHSSSSHESSTEEWIETPAKLMREEWQSNDLLQDIPTYTSQDVKSRKKEKVNIQTKQLSSFEKPGQHSKELNPFWKSGGDGLPTVPKNDEIVNRASPNIEWLERSLKRMQEQSDESGCSLEVIAAERYGSLKAFQKMLDNARGSSSNSSSKPKRFMKPQDGEKVRSRKYEKPTLHKSTPKWKKGNNESSAEKKTREITDDHKSSVSKVSANDVDKEASTASANATVTESKTKDQTFLTILSEEEKNKIGAKIVKAELMGNTSLVEKLKKKLEDSRFAEKQQSLKNSQTSEKSASDQHQKRNNSSGSSHESSDEEETVVLMRTSKTGQSWPVMGPDDTEKIRTTGKRRKKRNLPMTAQDGKREKYFDDDDKYSLRDLVEQEKSGSAEGNVDVMSRLSAKAFAKSKGDNFMLDDIFEAEAGKESASNVSSNRQKQITKMKKHMRRLENCKLCFGNIENPKHLIIAAGRVSYLRLPSHKVLQDGHCVIVPMHHSSAGTNLDEDVWDEIKKFMQSLCNMFSQQNKDCVFIQTCSNLQRFPHYYLECIPLPIELGDTAPIYFKKAIQECESEWSQNKKLVDTRGKTVKDKIPAGLPYFAVDFGLSGGFAHVIEDEEQFPLYFGREILGGMLDADPYLWRKPKEESFSDQMKRSLEFEKLFKSHDWTSTELR